MHFLPKSGIIDQNGQKCPDFSVTVYEGTPRKALVRVLGLLKPKEEIILTDQKIIDLYFARDEKAILETERAHGAFCMGVSMSILNNRMDAEECVNDTYLRAWNAIPPTIPRCLRAFLAKIVRNLSIDRYREKRRALPAAELEAALSELGEAIPAEAEREGAAALADLLDRFLRAEDEVDRRLFLGRYWHGAAVNELAAGSGLSPNAVTKRLGKTRERLRVYLSERGYSL